MMTMNLDLRNQSFRRVQELVLENRYHYRPLILSGLVILLLCILHKWNHFNKKNVATIMEFYFCYLYGYFFLKKYYLMNKLKFDFTREKYSKINLCFLSDDYSSSPINK